LNKLADESPMFRHSLGRKGLDRTLLGILGGPHEARFEIPCYDCRKFSHMKEMAKSGDGD
jgi:hypothetical protein